MAFDKFSTYFHHFSFLFPNLFEFRYSLPAAETVRGDVFASSSSSILL